jgi:hypothetical protein
LEESVGDLESQLDDLKLLGTRPLRTVSTKESKASNLKTDGILKTTVKKKNVTEPEFQFLQKRETRQTRRIKEQEIVQPVTRRLTKNKGGPADYLKPESSSKRSETVVASGSPDDDDLSNESDNGHKYRGITSKKSSPSTKKDYSYEFIKNNLGRFKEHMEREADSGRGTSVLCNKGLFCNSC